MKARVTAHKDFAIAKIDEVLKAEDGQSDKRAAHHGMRMLRAWLVHNGK